MKHSGDSCQVKISPGISLGGKVSVGSREVVGWTRPVLYGEPHTGPFVYTHTYLLVIKLGDRVRARRDKREKHPVSCLRFEFLADGQGKTHLSNI
ncbi:hypothetical protein E2C01_018724 [Portunus trituberculatus]|uniref:Uncharacterized protein n=1 Tax=Portunus trituberculatus TaxID=210409 RepID=A0A5B7DXW0_PORTR|nr:hypothetical protein [Portunus trituberculatus]